MSFGGPETMDELTCDSVFTTPPGHPNVAFIASSGDSQHAAVYHGESKSTPGPLSSRRPLIFPGSE